MGKDEVFAKPVVVVIGKGFGAYRGYNLEELQAAGRTVWMIDDEDLESDESDMVARLFGVDFGSDPRATARELKPFFVDVSVDVGICYIESLLPWAAAFFEEIGVAFISPDQAQMVRSKYQLREAFAAAGMSTPAHSRGTVDQILSLRFAYPFVIKPEFGYSSIGVELISNEDELHAYFGRKNNVHSEVFVLESVIDGDEYSIEGYVADGVPTPFAITRKFKTPRPYFEELAQFCSRKEALDDAHAGLFVQAVNALGIRSSLFHFEFIEKDGIRTPVEIGARLAGDKIPYLHRRVTGRSMLLEYLKDEVNFPRTLASGIGIVFFVPTAEGIVNEGFPAEQLGPALGEHFYEATAGKVVKTAPDDFFVRLGFCVVEADSSEEFVDIANEKICVFEEAAGVKLHRVRQFSSMVV